MHAIAKHLLLELKDCPPGILSDTAFIEKTIISASTQTESAILERVFRKTDSGISGVAMGPDAQFSIHTFPGSGYAAVDIFDSRLTTDFEAAAAFLAEQLQSSGPASVEIRRGVGTISEQDMPGRSRADK